MDDPELHGSDADIGPIILLIVVVLAFIVLAT